MTVATTTSAITYAGTGSTSVFPYTWQVNSAADLVVFTWVPATGAITKLALNTGYTLTGIGYTTGGTVVLTAGNLPSGTSIFIASDPALVQNLTLNQAAPFNASDLMNQLDYLTREVQAARRIATNGIQFPEVESLTGLVSALPVASQRASQFVAFDVNGNVTCTAIGPTGTLLPVNIVQTVATVAALRTYALTPSAGQLVQIGGLAAAGDGGQAEYYWNATDTRTDNGTTIIQITGINTGRWNALVVAAAPQLLLNVAALRLYAITPEIGYQVQTSGYYTAGDGGAGQYYWNATDTRTDNGGSIIQITGTNTGRWNLMAPLAKINVKQWGAYADMVHDDHAAIQAAISSIPTGQEYPVEVHFPCGEYLMTAGVTASNQNVVFTGVSMLASSLRPAFSGTCIAVNENSVGIGVCGIYNLGIREYGAQPGLTCYSITNCETSIISHVYLETTGRLIYSGTGIIFSMWVEVRGEAYGAQEAIRFLSGGGCISNCYIRKFRTAGTTGPTFWLQGQTTSLQVGNCAFSGKGTARSLTLTQITSTSSTFTITTSTAHLFTAGEWVVVNTGTGYDGMWMAASVTSTTITVTSTLNLGTVTPSGATLQKPNATLYIDNAAGPVNETSWSNVLFEGIDDGGSAGGIGSVSVMLDARVGGNSLEDNKFTGCYYDCGQTGIMLVGNNAGNGDLLCHGITINGGTIKMVQTGVFLQQVTGVIVTGIYTDCIVSQGNTNDSAMSCGLWINGTSEQQSKGITINGCHLGRSNDWRTDVISSRSCNYGIIIDGAPQDIYVTNNHIFGLVADSILTNTYGATNPIATNTRLVWANNMLASTVSGETTATRIPTIASASSITIGQNDIYIISGTNSISTITGGWIGRQVKLLCTGAVPFATGGNIASALTATAGQAVNLTHDGTNWHIG